MSVFRNIVMLLNREIPTDVLIKRGMKVGANFNRQQGCFIDPSHCFLITIGDNVTMSLRVTVLAHDASTKKILGYTKIGQVHIGNNVFLGANVTILPGVTIGDYAIIGAKSVVTHDIPAGTVAAGTPAKVICNLDDYRTKYQCQMNSENTFDASYRMNLRSGLEKDKIQKLLEATDGRIAFID